MPSAGWPERRSGRGGRLAEATSGLGPASALVGSDGRPSGANGDAVRSGVTGSCFELFNGGSREGPAPADESNTLLLEARYAASCWRRRISLMASLPTLGPFQK